MTDVERYTKEARGGVATYALKTAGSYSGTYTSIAIGSRWLSPCIAILRMIPVVICILLNAMTTSCNSSTATKYRFSNCSGIRRWRLRLVSMDFPRLPMMIATNNAVKFLKCHNISCASTTKEQSIPREVPVDGTKLLFQWQLGPTDIPVVSYYDATGGDLEFIKCLNISCSSATHHGHLMQMRCDEPISTL